MNAIPNFFLVGAFKCGTSAMASYLEEHPHVFMTVPKEPYYFATDFPNKSVATDDDAYLSLFRRANKRHAAVGEASVGYLYSAAAARAIRTFNPAAKLIVMLRNPVDLVQAFHSQLLFNLDEDEPNFARAWALQDQRRCGRRLPKHCRTPEFLQYRNVGMLGEQLERLFQVFPRPQVHVLFHEDFARCTADAYSATLDFLNVPHDGRTEFPAVNENKQHRSGVCAAMWMRRPRWTQRITRPIKTMLGKRRKHVERLVQLIYAEKVQRAEIGSQLRSELTETFRSDIDRLACLTGRDLSCWYTQKAAA